MNPEVWVEGRPLTSIAWWGELEVTHRWPLGSWEAKWEMPLDPWRRPPQLRADAPVEVKVGPHCIWCGNLVEPNWSEGTFAAVGACRQGEGAICFDGGLTTSVPDTAIDQAIAAGAIDWTRPASISAAAFSETEQTDAHNYVAGLLDAYALSVNQRWFVNPLRQVLLAADPTEPSALLMPDNGVLGVATEKQVGTVYVGYIDSATHAFDTVSYPPFGGGRPEKAWDYTSLGEISAAKALGIAEGIWSPLQAQTGWTNGLTVKTGQLRTMGNQEMPLWRFTAGQMLRLLGVRDLRGLSANTDVVIGESIWKPSDDSLRLNPVGKVARDIRSITEAAGGTLMPGFSG